jgi:hypothetical protein
MTDIFHHWKENRFVVAPAYAYEADGKCVKLVVLTDIKFWADSADELLSWCNEFGCTQKGMTVEFPEEDLLTAFCLRWS